MSEIFERAEKKYVLTAEQRRLIEEGLAGHIVADAHGVSTIRNIYYDTCDYRLVRRSIEKPVYKEKLRVRSYRKVSADDAVFVELKKKYKGIVYKRRIEMPECQVRDFLCGHSIPDENSQIEKEIRYFCKAYGRLTPRVFLCYDRNAYFGTDHKDLRISFDRNILWRTTDLNLTEDPWGRRIIDDSMSIMEIKAADAMPLWLVRLLNEAGAAKVSFSKYGTVYQTMLLEGSLEYLKRLCPESTFRGGLTYSGRERMNYA